MGQKVTGTVKAVHDFGCFVDFGGPRDALLNTERFTVGCNVHGGLQCARWAAARTGLGVRI